MFLKHILSSCVLSLLHHCLLLPIQETSTLNTPPPNTPQEANSFFQTFILSRMILFIEPLSRWNSFDPIYCRFACLDHIISESYGGLGKRERLACAACYPAFFTWLWEHKMPRTTSGAWKHLQTFLDVYWMAKWVNDGLPASKLGLPFQYNGTTSWLFSLPFPTLFQCALLPY